MFGRSLNWSITAPPIQRIQLIQVHPAPGAVLPAEWTFALPSRMLKQAGPPDSPSRSDSGRPHRTPGPDQSGRLSGSVGPAGPTYPSRSVGPTNSLRPNPNPIHPSHRFAVTHIVAVTVEFCRCTHRDASARDLQGRNPAVQAESRSLQVYTDKEMACPSVHSLHRRPLSDPPNADSEPAPPPSRRVTAPRALRLSLQ